MTSLEGCLVGIYYHYKLGRMLSQIHAIHMFETAKLWTNCVKSRELIFMTINKDNHSLTIYLLQHITACKVGLTVYAERHWWLYRFLPHLLVRLFLIIMHISAIQQANKSIIFEYCNQKVITAAVVSLWSTATSFILNYCSSDQQNEQLRRTCRTL